MTEELCDSSEFWALLMRPAADGKKLFLWREVLVLLDGRGWNSVCPGWEESATIFLARLRDLEGCAGPREVEDCSNSSSQQCG